MDSLKLSRNPYLHSLYLVRSAIWLPQVGHPLYQRMHRIRMHAEWQLAYMTMFSQEISR